MSTTEATCAIPDLGPDAYVQWRASELGAITERLERQLILEFVGNVEGDRVLDVGCGDGELALHLKKRGATVVGIDASPEMIAAATTRAGEVGRQISGGDRGASSVRRRAIRPRDGDHHSLLRR